MTHQYKVSRTGLSIEIFVPYQLARLPRPGTKTYQHLRLALAEFWIDSQQVFSRPPKPRMDDAYVELRLTNENVLLQFTHDEIRFTLADALLANPRLVAEIMQAVAAMASQVVNKSDECCSVSVRYWAHAVLQSATAETLLAEVAGLRDMSGLQVEKISFRLPQTETINPDTWIEIGSSKESHNGVFLDFNAILDVKTFQQVPGTLAESLLARADLLNRLNLISMGEEQFVSWFIAGGNAGKHQSKDMDGI